MTPSEQPTEPTLDVAPSKPTFAQPIVATPSRAFFIRRMVVAAVVIFGGLYLLYDGYKGWPDRNRRIADLRAEIAAAEAHRPADDDAIGKLRGREKNLGDEKQPRDILLQKVLGYPVALLGLYLAVRFFREGKGELRLADDTLHAPGHPPVPIAAIGRVNDQKWDRKGVAVFDYRLADGTAGRVKIDDFVFDRPPTDAIHDELIAKMPKA